MAGYWPVTLSSEGPRVPPRNGLCAGVKVWLAMKGRTSSTARPLRPAGCCSLRLSRMRVCGDLPAGPRPSRKRSSTEESSLLSFDRDMKPRSRPAGFAGNAASGSPPVGLRFFEKLLQRLQRQLPHSPFSSILRDLPGRLSYSSRSHPLGRRRASRDGDAGIIRQAGGVWDSFRAQIIPGLFCPTARKLWSARI